jgi:isoamylase
MKLSMIESKLLTSRGEPVPLGSSKNPRGINFSFVSSQAEQAEIHLFDPGSDDPFFIASLSSGQHKTGDTWHACVEGLEEPFEYSYKIYANSNWSPLLLDPYAKALKSAAKWNTENYYPNKARFFSIPDFDWQGVKKVKTPFREWVIYEMHVRAFSRHPSSGVEKPGTFLGLIEKIPHLKSLGINAVELLPIFEFNECENLFQNPKTKKNLVNFWGYSHTSFFCPMQRYASSSEWESPIQEFKELVRELHRNDIAVILDVVYNHTAEKGKDGPVFSFKGLDNSAYYLLTPEGDYYNFSGTGNSFNCNHPVSVKLIVDSLVYWAEEMQVDGFRFDLASILTRGESGEPLESPPLLEAMRNEPLLKNTHFIAEAWDCGGLYQVGTFPGKKNWAEWNGKFRDITRNFIKGTDGFTGSFAGVICGSHDLYSYASPSRSVNFVVAHDGYTLHDLVSYQEKHNLANGEENRDGNSNNLSWNCGAEGATHKQSILSLRDRQVKNFVVSLMLSLGVPMMFMGDEYLHTRHGNNNPYCQDNDLNWFLWDALDKNKSLFLFFQKMIHFRKTHKDLFCRDKFFTDKDIVWHGERVFNPEWDSGKNILSYMLNDTVNLEKYFVSFNAKNAFVLLQLPNLENQVWSQVINTSLQSPYDFIEDEKKRPLYKRSFLLPPHSVFVAKAVSLNSVSS